MIKSFTKLLGEAFDGFLNDRGFIRAAQIPSILPDVIFKNEVGGGASSAWYSYYRYWSDLEFQKLAMSNPWVFSNTKIIAQIVADGNLTVQHRVLDSGVKQIKWEDDPLHILNTVLDVRPNPYMGQFFVWMYQVLWYQIQGEAFWLLIPDKMGDLVQIWPLPANRVIPIPGTIEGLYKGFAYSPVDGLKPEILLPESICYHRFPNLFEYYQGYSSLTAYIKSLEIDTEAANFDLDDYKNALSLKQLVSVNPDMNESDFNQALQDFDDAAASNRRYMVVRGGDASVSSISQRRADANENIRDKMASQAGRIFGVFDGFWDRSANRASSERAEENTISYGAWPIMTMFAEDMTAQIVNRFYGEEWRVIFEDIRPRNRELELKESEHNRQVMLYGEARREGDLGQVDIEEFDEEDPFFKLLLSTPYLAVKEVAVEIAKAKIELTKRELGIEDPPTLSDIMNLNGGVNNPTMEDELPPNEPLPSEFPDESSIEEGEDMEDDQLRAMVGIISPDSQKVLIAEDLRRWRSVAIRLIRSGEHPGDYEFTSDVLSEDTMNFIKSSLMLSQTEEDVKAVFFQGKKFLPEGAAEFNPKEISPLDEAERLRDETVDETIELFNEVVPDLASILEG